MRVALLTTETQNPNPTPSLNCILDPFEDPSNQGHRLAAKATQPCPSCLSGAG